MGNNVSWAIKLNKPEGWEFLVFSMLPHGRINHTTEPAESLGCAACVALSVDIYRASFTVPGTVVGTWTISVNKPDEDPAWPGGTFISIRRDR